MNMKLKEIFSYFIPHSSKTRTKIEIIKVLSSHTYYLVHSHIIVSKSLLCVIKIRILILS